MDESLSNKLIRENDIEYYILGYIFSKMKYEILYILGCIFSKMEYEILYILGCFFSKK